VSRLIRLIHVRRVGWRLPAGRLLADDLWQRRHRGIVVLLWLHVPILAVFGWARGHGLLHSALETASVIGLTALASAPSLSRRVRATAASIGLVTCSALLVHFWDGTIEAHFHFFVVVSLLMLYQDWTPFLAAIGFVVVHHGVVGALDPGSVYAHGGNPWNWALIHGGFVLAACGANMVSWHANEQLLHDPLTRLPNRSVLLDRVAAALDRAGRGGPAVAVLFVDLDRFKVINDTLGHEVGDRLLTITAQRLRSAARAGELAARFGGDEFAVLCEVAGEAEALAMGERIVQLLRGQCELAGRELVSTASVGIAVSHGGAHTTSELLRNADAAMYHAKALGSDRAELFDAEIGAALIRRFEIETDLRRVLQRGELILHYQPEFSLSSGRIVAVEALLRWEHPQRGPVPPSEFVPVAEQTGMIVPIGSWVLHAACKQAAAWKAMRGATPIMRVNLSARQLIEPGLLEEVTSSLAEAGLQPEDLCLEITESLLMHDVDHADVVLQKIRDHGVAVALDDFGTGYSSLDYLRRLEVDLLKIDRSFMSDLTARPGDRVIVDGIIGMARALGLAVTAEGVETPGQLTRLRELGCDAAQGFLLAEPAPAHEVDLDRQLPRSEARRVALTG